MNESRSDSGIRLTLLHLSWLAFCISYLTLNAECNTSWSGCEGRIVDRNGNIFEDHSIDFSRVHINLYNKQGYIQQSVPCAPNGYYSMPIEDENRTYDLKINGPEGWHFSPPIYVVQNTCDQAKDFVFEGFSVVGKVTSKHSTQGIGGIKLSLYQKEILKSTATTQDNGQYVFSHILPGKVTIKAADSEFHFINNYIESQVLDNKLFMVDDFVIDGYPVEGQLIITEGEFYYPIWEATAIIYPSDKTAPENICTLKPSEIIQKLDGAQLTQTDMEGNFVFQQTLMGTYNIVTCGPKDKPNCITSPSPYFFEVKHSPVKIEPTFEITSFTQAGIVTTKEGAPLKGASITIDNRITVSSDEGGHFYVPNTTPGYHSVEVYYPNFYFDEQNQMKFSYIAQNPIEIIATAFDICGTVYQPQKAGASPGEYKPDNEAIISVQKPDGSDMLVSTQKGSYCFKSEAGNYNISVYNDPKQEWLYTTSPASRMVTILDSPIKSVDFYKNMFNMQVEVSTLEPYEQAFDFSLVKYNKNTMPNPVEISLANGESYQLHPGKYELTIKNSNWIFENQTITLETGKDVNLKAQFKQTGFKLEGTIDEDATIVISDFKEPESFKQAYKLKSGPFSLSMPHSNDYKLMPDNCTTLEKEYFTTNSDSLKATNIKVKERLLIGSVLLPQSFNIQEIGNYDFCINAFDSKGKLLDSVKPQFNSYTNKFDYQMWISKLSDFTYFEPAFTRTGMDVKFVPSKVFRSDMTFDNSGCLTTPDVQLEIGQNIYIKFGQLYEGESLVRLTNSKGTTEYQEFVKTNLESVKLGPIFNDLHMPIEAHIDGYHLQAEGPTNFLATRISELKIFFDSTSNQDAASLEGASIFLTSLNDTQYKQKKYLSSSLEATFSDIPTGSYLIQAIMKEFAFNPSQQTVTIAEGEYKVLNWNAKRVTYSCYGKIESLFSAQSDFKELFVEAENKDYGIIDASVNTRGFFTLKGLAPHVDYTVSIVSHHPTEFELQRFSPSSQIVNLQMKDKEGVIFHQIPVSTQSIFGKLTDIPLDDVFTIELYEKDSNKLFASQQLHLNNYFEFPGLPSNTYNLSVYKGQTSQKKAKKSLEIFNQEDIQFDGKNKFVEVKLDNKVPQEEKTPTGTENNLKTSPMISIIILGFIFYYYIKSTDLDKAMLNWWNKDRLTRKKQK